MRTTIKQLVEKTGVSQVEINGFVKTCVHLGLARQVDKIKTSSGKGKPAFVYELDEQVVSLLESTDVYKG